MIWTSPFPQQYLHAKIHSLVGDEPVASRYNNVVADGESIWLELPENTLNLSMFKKRQTTSSRQYYTLNGVTIHKQLELETGRIPRRHKLAVRIIRNEPSSRLLKGKWYVHAHQIKIQLPTDSPNVWRKLHTAKLVRKLRSTFGACYHPRTSQTRSLPSYWKHKPYHNGKSSRTRVDSDNQKICTSNQQNNLNTNGTPGRTPTFFPWPMQGPQPWGIPHTTLVKSPLQL